jgi:hypothetical protein
VAPRLVDVHAARDAAALAAARVRVYPVLLLLGWLYVRAAERNERDFTDVVERTMSRAYGVVAVLWSPSPRCRSAPTAGGSRGPPATSSWPRARSGPALNASAIGGEYLSAASFLGVAGLVLAFGADMLWYPVGWTAGYLVLLVLVPRQLRGRAPTRCRTSPRPRLESRSVRHVSSLLVSGSAGST